MQLLTAECAGQGSTQRKRAFRKCKLRGLLQKMGLYDPGGWLGKSQIISQATTKGRLELAARAEAAVHKHSVFLKEASARFLRPFN